MLAISIPAFLFADSWGRRASIITGGIGLSGCMFIIGSLYAADSVHSTYGPGRWLVIVLIFIFALTFCATWAIVGKIYASEIQPVQTRAAANSVAQGLGFVSVTMNLSIDLPNDNYQVHKLARRLRDPHLPCHSSFGAYFLFGGLSFFTLVVLAVYMPETRGCGLEEIQDAFSKPLVNSATLGRKVLGATTRHRRNPRVATTETETSIVIEGGEASRMDAARGHPTTASLRARMPSKQYNCRMWQVHQKAKK